MQMKLIFSSFCKKDVDFLLHVKKKVHIVNYNLPPSNTVVIKRIFRRILINTVLACFENSGLITGSLRYLNRDYNDSRLQWNPVNTVTNGPKIMAVLPRQAQISWLEGGNDKYTLHHIHRTVLINKQPECRYRVQ